MFASRAVESDRDDDALDRSPSATQSSMPPTSRRRRRRPSGLKDAPRCQRATTPLRGVTRRCASARAVVATTRRQTGRVRRLPARASPLRLLNKADRGGSVAPPRISAIRHSHLRGRVLVTNQNPAPEWRFVRMHAGGDGSVGPISDRGKRTAAPMSARRAAESDRVGDALDRSPSATQSSMPPTCRRRRRRPSVVKDAPRGQRATTPLRGVTQRRASARAVVSTTRGQTGRVRRRPARAPPLMCLGQGDDHADDRLLRLRIRLRRCRR